MSLSSSRVLVVGSGVIGLRTTLELIRRKIPVVLLSPKHPLDSSVCSQGAGGLWMPYHCDDTRTNRWAMETLNELYPMATKPFQNNNNNNNNNSNNNPYWEDALVEIVPTVALKRTTITNSTVLPEWCLDARLQFQQLTMEMLWWQNQKYQLKLPSLSELVDAGYPHAWLFYPPIVNTPKMLQFMLQEIQQHSQKPEMVHVNVDTNVYYESNEHVIEEAKRYDCHGGIINCTGFGFGFPLAELSASSKDEKKTKPSGSSHDPMMIGGRGVLLHYDRATCIRRQTRQGQQGGSHHKTTSIFTDQPDDDPEDAFPRNLNNSTVNCIHDAVILAEEPPYGTELYPCYMIPRGTTIVVGGSFIEGDFFPTIRPKERQRLLHNAHVLGIDTAQTHPIGEWVGFRPYRRQSSRCEVNPVYTGTHDDTIRLVHSYGYGGSGWTVYVGCAKEAVQLLFQK